MVTGHITDTGRFFFNLSANVGLASPNREDDVQLVQLGYACMGRNPLSKATDAVKAIYAAVIPGAPYAATPDDPLTRAIVAHQKERGGIQDGHVSTIKDDGTYFHREGVTGYMLIALVNSIFDLMPAPDFPRIDRHPLCPDVLRAAVIEICTL